MGQILQYDHVEISYNGTPVVHDISFALNEGEILGIVGESGSGKSTLIRAAMGLLGDTGMVTRGDILYKGKNCPDLKEKEMRLLNGPELGMIFQNASSSFCAIRTVGTQLFESMKEHRNLSKREFMTEAEALFSRLGFEDAGRILSSCPFELSGGMAQRVGVAAAMLMKPSVLLADEPTSALDVSIQKQVAEEMLAINQEFGTSIILVTHNIGLIRFMAEKVLVMRNGEAMEYGETDRVLNQPEHEYTKRLLAAVPRLKR